jgi:selenophosphate synthase
LITVENVCMAYPLARHGAAQPRIDDKGSVPLNPSEVVLALNICGFPIDLPSKTISEILRRGAEKIAEAGAVLAGGHTVIDEEPKYGLVVMGFVHPDHIVTKAAAQVGDVQMLLYTPETSGGLLIAVAEIKLGELIGLFDREGQSHWIIGRVVGGKGIEVVNATPLVRDET